MKPRTVLLTLLLLLGGIGVFLFFKNDLITPPQPQQVSIEAVPTATVVEVPPKPTSAPTAIPESTPSPHSIPSSTAPGKISGRVTTQDGEPIAGCEVIFLFEHGKQLRNFIKRGRYRESEPFTVTDATGFYCGETLLAGPHRVVFIPSGYLMTAYPKLVEVSPGKTSENIDQVLESAGILAGTVTENLSGKPIEGVKILIKHTSGDYPSSYGWNTAVGWPREVAVHSNKKGNFKFDFIPNKELYDLQATHPDYAPINKENIRVESDQSIRIVMSPGGSIEGRVVSEIPGIDLKKAYVLAWIDEDVKEATKCKENGTFLLQGLPPNTYQLLAVNEKRGKARSKLSEPIYIGLGKNISGIELKLEHLPKVCGQVIDKITREGIPDVWVGIRPNRESARTDSEGRFEIGVFQWGPCSVYIQTVTHPYLQPDRMEGVDVVIGDQDVDDVILELMPGAVVRGKVLSQTGEAIRNARVEAWMKLGENKWDQSRLVYTGKDGTFELSQLKPSQSCRVRASFSPPPKPKERNSGHYYNDPGMGAPSQLYNPMIPGNRGMGASYFGASFYQKVTARIVSEPFSLAEGEIKEDLILQLEPCASISGNVKDAQGNPVSEGYQIAFSQILPEGNRFLYHTQLNDQGFYFSNELPSGEISVSLTFPLGRVPSPLRCFFHKSKDVTTQAGKETSGVDFIVPRQEGHSISGRVVDDQGNGTSGRHVLMLDSIHDEPNEVAWGVTDENGFFQGENRPGGRYLIWVSRDHKYYDGYLEHVDCPAEGLEVVTPRLAQVRGRIVSKSTGKPVPRFQMGFFGDQEKIHKWPEQFKKYFHDKGKFAFNNVPPKPVLLKVKTKDDKVYEHPLNLKPGELLEDLVIEVE